MKTLKHTTVTSNLGKIVKPPAIFLLFGLMGFTFLAEGQGIIIQDPRAASNYWKYYIESQTGMKFMGAGMRSSPEGWDERTITGPGGGPSLANRPWGAARTPTLPAIYDHRNYSNRTPQRQSGRTLQWKTGAGQQLRLDRLYLGLDANLILKAFGHPDKVSWQYSTWTYQNLNIQNPLTGRQYRNVTFVVKNRKIQYASVH